MTANRINRVSGGGPGSGPQGGPNEKDKGPSYAGHSSGNVQVAKSGQIKLKTPRNVKEANQMIATMGGISDAAVADFAAVVGLHPDSDARVRASLRLAHVSLQTSRAIAMAKPFAASMQRDIGLVNGNGAHHG